MSGHEVEKHSKSKRALERELSPKPIDNDERRGRSHKEDSRNKRSRKDGDDSESLQRDVDLLKADILDEVVEPSQATVIPEKTREKHHHQHHKNVVAAAAAASQTPAMDSYDHVYAPDEQLSVVSTNMGMDGSSRGWTEPIKEQKKTHFSAKETEILKNAITDYLKRIGYKEDNMSDFLFSKKRDLQTGRDGIWPEIAKCLPHRSVASVYYHAKRRFRELKRGAWEETEIEDLRKYAFMWFSFLTIHRLVQQHGTKWEKIGATLNRTAHSCRDKWRDLSVPIIPMSGKWSKEEDKRLKDAIMEVHEGVIPETGVHWSQVAEKMKDTGRARSQCRFRWESLKKGFDGEDVKQFWSQADCLALVERIRESGVEDETEIVWRQIQPNGFPHRTAKDLYNKWRYLKSLYCSKTFQGKEPLSKVIDVIRAGLEAAKN